MDKLYKNAIQRITTHQDSSDVIFVTKGARKDDYSAAKVYVDTSKEYFQNPLQMSFHPPTFNPSPEKILVETGLLSETNLATNTRPVDSVEKVENNTQSQR